VSSRSSSFDDRPSSGIQVREYVPPSAALSRSAGTHAGGGTYLALPLIEPADAGPVGHDLDLRGALG